MSSASGLSIRRLVAGALSGIAGLASMQLVHRLSSPIVGRHDQHPDQEITDAIARIVYSTLRGHTPSPRQERALSWSVHLGYGLVASAGCGLARDPRGRHPVRDGIVFGTGLWLVAGLVAPLLDRADPRRTHAPHHAQMLADHLGYGIASTLAARSLERALT